MKKILAALIIGFSSTTFATEVRGAPVPEMLESGIYRAMKDAQCAVGVDVETDATKPDEGSIVSIRGYGSCSGVHNFWCQGNVCLDYSDMKSFLHILSKNSFMIFKQGSTELFTKMWSN